MRLFDGQPTHASRDSRWSFRFAACAIFLLVLFGVFHLLGWRDDTAVLSGTMASSAGNAATLHGLLYALCYFLAAVLSPILILAAVIDRGLRRLGADRAGNKNACKSGDVS